MLSFLHLVRPSIKHGSTEDVTVTRGGNVTLQCAAEGVPRPAVTWLKDGRPVTGHHGAKVLNEGQLLQIKDAKVSDTGRYTCIAVNVAGQADSKYDISVNGIYGFYLVFLSNLFLVQSYERHLYSFFSRLSSSQYNRSDAGARERECSCEEPSSTELRGLRNPSSCCFLAERRSTNQSYQFCSHPVRSAPTHFFGLT